MSLQLTYDDLRLAASIQHGFGNDLTALSTENLATIERFVRDGLAQACFHAFAQGDARPHQWSFLRPVEEIVLWQSVAVDSAMTCTATAQNGIITVISTDEAFYETMIGKTLTVTTVGDFTIQSYYSPTKIQCAGADSWSAKTFSIAADGDYRLPDTFMGLLSTELTYEDQTAVNFGPIAVVDVGMIRRLRQAQNQVLSYGPPRYAAVAPIRSDGEARQRWTLMVYPIPQTTLTAKGQWQIEPDMLSPTRKYPPGGSSFAQLLKESVLARCEKDGDDEVGIHTSEYERLLAIEIMQDRERHMPSKGRMLRDPALRRRGSPWSTSNVITSINGTITLP